MVWFFFNFFIESSVDFKQIIFNKSFEKIEAYKHFFNFNDPSPIYGSSTTNNQKMCQKLQKTFLLYCQKINGKYSSILVDAVTKITSSGHSEKEGAARVDF